MDWAAAAIWGIPSRRERPIGRINTANGRIHTGGITQWVGYTHLMGGYPLGGVSYGLGILL